MLRFFYHQLTLIFTNGQAYSCFSFFRNLVRTFRVKVDYFSNKLWQALDEPKLFANLVRFERRYGAQLKAI